MLVTKKPLELKVGEFFEGGASLYGVRELEVEEKPRRFMSQVYVKVCELDWPLAIPFNEDVRMVTE